MVENMFIIVHRTGTDLPDASAEFACRVLARVTNRELLSLKNGLILKIPEKEGDSELIRKFYQKYPKYIMNYSRMPDEVEASNYVLEQLGGVSKVGYRFLTSVLDANRVKYDIIDRNTL